MNIKIAALLIALSAAPVSAQSFKDRDANPVDVQPAFANDPFAGDPRCAVSPEPVDYTVRVPFSVARRQAPGNVVTHDFRYIGRWGIDPADTWQQFFGNVMFVTSADIYCIRNSKDDPRLTHLWVDWSAFDLARYGVSIEFVNFIGALEGSKAIRVSYDEVTGIVTAIEIIA